MPEQSWWQKGIAPFRFSQENPYLESNLPFRVETIYMAIPYI